MGTARADPERAIDPYASVRSALSVRARPDSGSWYWADDAGVIVVLRHLTRMPEGEVEAPAFVRGPRHESAHTAPGFPDRARRWSRGAAAGAAPGRAGWPRHSYRRPPAPASRRAAPSPAVGQRALPGADTVP